MQWNPTQYFDTTSTPSPFALLILNQPINERAFSALRRHAKYTLCADGGANRYYDLMRRYGQETTNLPDAIVGDLDSIRPSVRDHYARLGVLIIQDTDQYSTDFTKCLLFLRERTAELVQGSDLTSQNSVGGRQLDVLVLGGLGGRVDQAFSQIHHLYTVSVPASTSASASASREGRGDQEQIAPGNLYLISEESITFILRQGRNEILTPGRWESAPSSASPPDPADSPPECLGENVGVIPLTGPTRISTQGFEWDVQGWRTAIGGNLSTSNHIRAGRVVVECEEAVLFTLELADRLKVGRGGVV